MSRFFRVLLLLSLATCFFGSAYLVFHDKPEVPEIQRKNEYQTPQLPSRELALIQPDPRAHLVEVSGSPAQSSQQSLKEMMRRDSEGLTLCEHSDGGASVNLQGRFSHVTVAVPSGDGGWIIRCFDNYEEMQAALSGSLPAASESSTSNEPVYQ